MGDRTDRTVRRRVVVAAAVCAALAPGCQSLSAAKEKVSNFHLSSSYDDPRAAEKMAEADRLFAEQKYDAAGDRYKELADNTGNNSTLAERARFQQAECRRLRGEYPKAVDTYNRLLRDFSTGAHRREACARMFEISDYWLDDFRDELTARAAKGEKGVLHWRPRWPNPLDKSKPFAVQEARALEALEHVHTQDVTGAVADKAIFWCGYVNFVRGNFDEADQFFSQLVELHKDSPLRPQAIAYAIQAKNNATGGAVYDGRKCAEALHLVHVAEGSVPELTQDPAMADKLTRAKFAIRHQQAEKDFKTAEYYERTGHPGSAVFYYELVRRRYAGTQYADVATERKDQITKDMGEGKVQTGRDPWTKAQAKWGEWFGPKDADAADPSKNPPRAPVGRGSVDRGVGPAAGTAGPRGAGATP